MRLPVRAIGRVLVGMAIVVTVVVFNRDVLLIRLVEIDALIRTASGVEQADAGELLLRYRLLAARLEGEIDHRDQLQAEAMLAVMSERPPDTGLAVECDRLEASVAFRALNGLRNLIGKTPLVLEPDAATTDRIARAYMLERARRWPEAVVAYRDALDLGGLRDTERANLRLHLGFCLSMDGRHDEARNVFTALAEQTAGTEHARAAREMIAYLDRITRYRDETDQAIPGRRDFLVLDFRSAIDQLDRFIETEPDPEEEAEARYYRGRALEETGRFDEAILEYERIASLPASEWTRAAARRLVIIADYYRPDEEARAQGTELLVELRDQEFLAMVERYGRTRGETPAVSVGPSMVRRETSPGERSTPEAPVADLATDIHPAREDVSSPPPGPPPEPMAATPNPLPEPMAATPDPLPEPVAATPRPPASSDRFRHHPEAILIGDVSDPETEYRGPSDAIPPVVPIVDRAPAESAVPETPRSDRRAPDGDPLTFDPAGRCAADQGEADRGGTPPGAGEANRDGTPPGAGEADRGETPPGAGEARRDGTPPGAGEARRDGTPPGAGEADRGGTPPGAGEATESLRRDSPADEAQELSARAGSTDPGDRREDYLGPITGIGADGTFFVEIEAIHLRRDRIDRLSVVVIDESGETAPIAARRTAVVDHTMIARLVDPAHRHRLGIGLPVYLSR